MGYDNYPNADWLSSGIKGKTDQQQKYGNDFIPYVDIDRTNPSASYDILTSEEYADLSEHLDLKFRKPTLSKAVLHDDAVLEFIVKKGNSKANDNEGDIRVVSHGLEFTSAHKRIGTGMSSEKNDNNKKSDIIEFEDIEYGFKIKVKVLERSIQDGAYIDFFANDDDLYFYSVSNVHCGRLLVESDKVCGCEKASAAKTFSELVDLVTNAENILISNRYKDVGDRISIIRGIYYGTSWSLDYSVEKSIARNIAFNEFVGSWVVADARRELKCSSRCRNGLFSALYDSFEVFDGKSKAVDFGHIIIGLDSRRSWRSKNVPIPFFGGTGLELNTWVGDLGGGCGKLSLDRATDASVRAITLFPKLGHSYGSMVNLEGDVAAYVVGMSSDNEDYISDIADSFGTIHDALEDYFTNKWPQRANYFLRMLGAEFEDKEVQNQSEIEAVFAKAFEDFGYQYILQRKGLSAARKASSNLKAVAQEVAEVFFSALLHVVGKPHDMITSRIDPDPTH